MTSDPSNTLFSDSMLELTKTFRPMLSGSIKQEADLAKLTHLRRMPHPFGENELPPLDTCNYIGSPKLDGIRTLIHPDARIGACTRTLKPIRNRRLHQYFLGLANTIPEVFGLDGELTAGRTEEATALDVFNRTTSAVMSYEGDVHRTPQLTYFIFDKFYSHKRPFSSVDTLDYHHLPYYERLKQLQIIIEKIHAYEHRYIMQTGSNPPIHCQLLEFVPLYTKGDILREEKRYLDMGYEGLMIRHPAQVYKFGRSAITATQQHLIKLKRFEDAEGVVIGFDELMHNLNEAEHDAFGLTERSAAKSGLSGGDTLGTLRIRVITGEFTGIEVGLGTGFDQEQRRSVWNRRNEYLGAIVTFKYQAIGSVDAPRFPVFKAFRKD